VPAAIFLPDRSPHALDAVRGITIAMHACGMHACRVVHLRTTATSSAHEHTHSLAVCAQLQQLQIANQHFKRGSHMAHTSQTDATPCADRRHGEHDHVTDLLRSSSILVLYMCTKRVRRVELWTMHHASLITYTSYFSFCFTHRRTAGLVLLQHLSTLDPAWPASTSLRVWQPATTIISFS
jgi:hypothetical protein